MTQAEARDAMPPGWSYGTAETFRATKNEFAGRIEDAPLEPIDGGYTFWWAHSEVDLMDCKRASSRSPLWR